MLLFNIGKKTINLLFFALQIVFFLWGHLLRSLVTRIYCRLSTFFRFLMALRFVFQDFFPREIFLRDKKCCDETNNWPFLLQIFHCCVVWWFFSKEEQFRRDRKPRKKFKRTFLHYKKLFCLGLTECSQSKKLFKMSRSNMIFFSFLSSCLHTNSAFWFRILADYWCRVTWSIEIFICEDWRTFMMSKDTLRIWRKHTYLTLTIFIVILIRVISNICIAENC